MKKIIIESLLIALIWAVVLFGVGSYGFATFDISKWAIEFRAFSAFMYVIITAACIGANITVNHEAE